MGSADVQIAIMGAKQDMSDMSAKTREIERLEAEARRANEQLGRMKKTTDEVRDAFNNSLPSVSSFKRALASVGGIYVFQKLASDIVRVRGEMEQMEVAEKPRPTKTEDRKEPSPLMTDGARKYWQRLQQAHFVDADCRLLPDTTRKQAMYIADLFADKLRLTSKWKPFQDLWGINNLAQEKWEVQQTGTLPSRYYEIDKIFED